MSTPAATKQAAATTALTPYQQQYRQIQQKVEGRKLDFDKLIPKTSRITVDQLVVAGMMCCQRDQSLVQCGNSFLLSLAHCAILGLLPGTPEHHVAIINYGGTATPQTEVRGFIALALRSGKVERLIFDAVYEGEKFGIDRNGRTETWFHSPDMELRSRLQMVGGLDNYKFVYCTIVPTDEKQTPMPFYMSKAEVEHIRNTCSRAWKSGGNNPWKDHSLRMAIKTVIKRALTYFDASPEVATAIDIDNKIEAGEEIKADQYGIPVEVEDEPVVTTKTDAVAQKLKEKVGKSKPGTTEASGVTTAEASHTPTNPPSPENVEYATPSDWDKCIAYGDTAGLGEEGCVEELEKVFHYSPNEIPLEFLPQVTEHFKQLAEKAQEAQ